MLVTIRRNIYTIVQGWRPVNLGPATGDSGRESFAFLHKDLSVLAIAPAPVGPWKITTGAK